MELCAWRNGNFADQTLHLGTMDPIEAKSTEKMRRTLSRSASSRPVSS